MTLVCLQGGAEFSAACRPMDARVVRRAAGGAAAGAAPVRTVVVALAAAPGREYDVTAANGVAYYLRLGADAVAAPDAREDADGAVAAVRGAGLVVLPGGSPSGLLTALRETGVGAALKARLADGCVLSGASAGAMVLGGWTVLPDERGPQGLAVVPALSIVPDVVVVPHWGGGSSRRDWLRAVAATVPGDTTVLGLPEHSGVLVTGRVVTAVGREPVELIGRGVRLSAGQSAPLS